MAKKKIGSIRRRGLSVSTGSLVETEPLFADGGLPLLVRPSMEGTDLIGWASSNRDFIDEKLLHHGGLLFRDFGLREAEDLERFIAAAAGEALEYKERSSPRHAVSGNIYTSTDYPPEYPIFLHNENSYQAKWPLKIFFFCHTPAVEGGQTPIADCRRIYRKIDPEVRRRFEDQGWMYVRNFGDGFGLDWPTVFQTEDRAAVDEHCRRNGIETEWKEGGRLRTTAVRPAVARHPKSGEATWFNHATFFHVTTLEPEVQASLREEFSDDELPANTYYGDGTPIEPETLDYLRGLYHEETVRFPWQRGDLLLLDNMLTAHGRAPFSGERKILVGMAEPVSREEIAA